MSAPSDYVLVPRSDFVSAATVQSAARSPATAPFGGLVTPPAATSRSPSEVATLSALVASGPATFEETKSRRSPPVDLSDVKVVGTLMNPAGFLSKGPRASTRSSSRLPRCIAPNPRYRDVITYRVGGTAGAAASNHNIGVGGLIQAGGCMATSTTNLVSICSSVLIHSVTLYPPGNNNTGNVAFVQWNNILSPTVPDDVTISVLPDGITAPSCVVCRPPPKSLAADWLTTAYTAGTLVLNIGCVPGTIIELDCTWRMQANLAGYTGITGSSLVVGDVYYVRPDGVGQNIIPIGLLNV
jgi:hypothetical protein